MRTYTYGVGAQLVRELEAARTVAHILHDGNDLIHVQLVGGEHVMIYLIERNIPAYEVRKFYLENTRAGHYTLFVLWADMLLPDDGQRHVPDEGLEALLALYQDKVFAYEIYMEHLFMFPVNFQRIPYQRECMIRHGDPIDVETLHPHTIETRTPKLYGTWRIASFDAHATHQRHVSASDARLNAALHTLSAQYALFDLTPSSDRAAIKRAYRQQARLVHPDLNRSAGAKAQMQQINAAYDAIMKMLNSLSAH